MYFVLLKNFVILNIYNYGQICKLDKYIYYKK